MSVRMFSHEGMARLEGCRKHCMKGRKYLVTPEFHLLWKWIEGRSVDLPDEEDAKHALCVLSKMEVIPCP